MRKKHDWFKILGFAGTALGMLATVISEWSQQKEMENTVEEKVNEALARKNEEES